MILPKLQTLYFVSAVVYLVSLMASPYFMDFAVKALPIVVLLGICISHLNGLLRKLMIVALVASATGDVFLALDIPHGFVMGLGSFLVAQLIYTFCFVKYRQVYEDKSLRLSGSFIVGIFAVLMALYVLPHTGEMLAPVAFYLVIISCMGMVAFLCGMDKMTLLGACLFIVSDAIIAQSVFRSDFPYSSLAIMTTYYLAQYFILHGLIKLQSERQF